VFPLPEQRFVHIILCCQHKRPKCSSGKPIIPQTLWPENIYHFQRTPLVLFVIQLTTRRLPFLDPHFGNRVLVVGLAWISNSKPWLLPISVSWSPALSAASSSSLRSDLDRCLPMVIKMSQNLCGNPPNLQVTHSTLCNLPKLA
jgi:hypothetical protein